MYHVVVYVCVFTCCGSGEEGAVLERTVSPVNGVPPPSFQIDLQFSQITEQAVLDRGRKAVELMLSSGNRGDSVTKNRTEFTYSTHF